MRNPTRLSITLALAALLAFPPLTGRAELPATPWPARLATPPLALQDLSGQAVSLASLKGRVVLVNFWGTWCDPCREEMPTLQQLADLYGGDGFTVLTVNVKDTPAKAAIFMRNAGLNMPVLRDAEGAVARQWGVRIFPTSVLIGADGRARWRVVGAADWTDPEAGKLIGGLLHPRAATEGAR